MLMTNQAQSQKTPVLLTVEDFGRAVGLSAVTIRRWVAARRLSSVRLGARSVRIPSAEIDRLLESGLTPSIKG